MPSPGALPTLLALFRRRIALEVARSLRPRRSLLAQAYAARRRQVVACRGTGVGLARRVRDQAQRVLVRWAAGLRAVQAANDVAHVDAAAEVSP